MTSNNNSRWSPGVAAAIAVVACSLLVFLARENAITQGRLSRIEESLARLERSESTSPTHHGTPATSDPLVKLAPTTPPNLALPTPPPTGGEPPPRPPRLLEARVFALELRLDDQRFSRFRRLNDEWVSALEQARQGRLTPEELALAIRRHALDLKGVLGNTPNGMEKYDQFIASLPGPHLVVTAPDGTKLTGARFE